MKNLTEKYGNLLSTTNFLVKYGVDENKKITNSDISDKMQTNFCTFMFCAIMSHIYSLFILR